MKALAGVFLFAAAAAVAQAPQPVTSKIAPKVWVVFAARPESREPDGNSVVFEAPHGLVIVDTGRHAWHREALLQLAKARRRPIAAIINSHWHLDHDSGNPYLCDAYPHLVVYASNAIDEALQGFLADSLKDSPRYLADESLPAGIREDVAADRLAILNAAALRPDVIVKSSKTFAIGGKVLRVKLARHAATAGDVWVLDAASGVTALGDLVTLPAPYLETACPAGWSKALKSVSETTFKTAIPGHGPKLSAADVLRYRTAFDAFLRCAASDETPEQCAAAWADGVSPLLMNGGYDPRAARGAAAYYVGLLRESNFQKRYCGPD